MQESFVGVQNEKMMMWATLCFVGDLMFCFCILTGNSWTWTTGNKAVATLQSNWPDIYEGERIALRCEIKDGGDAEWEYRWLTSSSQTSSYNPHIPELSISFAYVSHSGYYRCMGTMKSGQQYRTEWSDYIKLTVSGSKSQHVSFRENIYSSLKGCFSSNMFFILPDRAGYIWSMITAHFHSETSFPNRTQICPHCVSIMAESRRCCYSELWGWTSVCRVEVLLV